MLSRCWLVPACSALVLSAGVGAGAGATEPPLEELKAEKLAALAPLLTHGDIALIEFKPGGRMRQVTVMTLVGAPPEALRAVLLAPEKWKDFVPGIARSVVQHQPDGSLIYDISLDLKITSLRSNNRMSQNADGSVEVRDTDPNDATNHRWKFIGVPRGPAPTDGEDTILVQYGYTDVLHANPFIQRIVRDTPSLEHGLALSVQLAYVRAMKARAESLAGLHGPAAHKGAGPGFSFLLERGRVAVIRNAPSGRLADISILDTFSAPVARIEEIIGKPGAYAQFMDGLKRSTELERDAGETVYQTRFDLSVLGFDTRWALRKTSQGGAHSIDGIGLSGSFAGAHFRWDLTGRGEHQTLVVYRASMDLLAASPLLLGTVFRILPLFEHGLAVALGLVNVIGIRERAEGRR